MASAEGFISPFIGFDYGGDSGCPVATGCEDKSGNIGVAGGALGRIAGAEVEFGYARDFFGDAAGVDSSVLTLMVNGILGPKIGAVRPYVVSGVGLIKSHVEFDLGSILDSSNSFGWNLGGGLMVLFGDHVGVRGDVRRFKSFDTAGVPLLFTSPLSPLLGVLDDQKLSFNRASLALVLAF